MDQEDRIYTSKWILRPIHFYSNEDIKIFN